MKLSGNQSSLFGEQILQLNDLYVLSRAYEPLDNTYFLVVITWMKTISYTIKAS